MIYPQIDFLNTDILVAANYYGLECKKMSTKEYVTSCCFHDERTPSLYFYSYESPLINTFKCFGCGATGGIYKFVSLKENTDDKGVIMRKINEIYGNDTPIATTATNAPTKEKMPPKPKELNITYHAVYEDVLNFCSQHPNKKAYDYLTKERKLSPQMIEKAMIRTFEGRELERYLKAKYSVDDLRLFGFVSENNYFGFRNYQILIPYCDMKGKIFNLQARTLSTHVDKKYKYKFLSGKKISTYNLHNLPFVRGGKCCITEGVIDCLSVYELKNLYPDDNEIDFDLTLGFPSATIVDKDLLELLKANEMEVTLFLDKDGAGEKLKEKIDEIAKKIGLDVYFVKLSTKDVNELLLLHYRNN